MCLVRKYRTGRMVTMSNIAEFATKVKEMLGKAGYETDVVNGFKVNKELTGLSIKENNNNRETGLTVYLDAYYAKYICGNLCPILSKLRF